MTTSFDPDKTRLQVEASAALAAALQPGEELLEFTAGRFNTGILSNQEFWIGLTGQRLLLVRPKKRQQVYSIFFTFIDAISAPSKGLLPLLTIRLRPAVGVSPLKENLVFTPRDLAWGKRTQSLVDRYARLAAWDAFRREAPNAQKAVLQVQELRELGAPDAAQDLLKALVAASPTIKAEPGVQDLLKMMRRARLSTILAAGMFAIVVLFLAFSALQGQARLAVGIILAVLAIVDLLRGKPSARTNALALGLLAAGVNIIFSLIDRSLLDVIVWGSFGLAMVLLLLGNPDRLRIAAGLTAFLVGTVGVFVFVVAGAQYFPAAVNAFVPKPSGPFVDDFSTDQKWTQTDNNEVTIGLENGAYAITVKQPSLSYLSFPPISYYPSRGEVDVRLPEGSLTPDAGAYGLVCRYQKNSGKYYMAYIAPLTAQFAIFRIDGQIEAVPLTNPPLQDLQGLKEASQPNRIGLSCQDNQVTLALNGVQQAQISDPGMAQFGEGQLGLMVSTYAAVPAGGFKVVFDNASFWP